MTKKDIIDIVSEKTRLKKNHTKAVVECVFDVFIQMLARDRRIEIRNFGVFKVKDTPARVGRNPVTKEAAPVPPRRIVQFKAGKEMKELVNRLSALKKEKARLENTPQASGGESAVRINPPSSNQGMSN